MMTTLWHLFLGFAIGIVMYRLIYKWSRRNMRVIGITSCTVPKCRNIRVHYTFVMWQRIFSRRNLEPLVMTMTLTADRDFADLHREREQAVCPPPLVNEAYNKNTGFCITSDEDD